MTDVLAFYLIWIVWRLHHTLFDQIRSVSSGMIALHFPLLLLAAFLPYATTVLGHYPDRLLGADPAVRVVGTMDADSVVPDRAGR